MSQQASDRPNGKDGTRRGAWLMQKPDSFMGGQVVLMPGDCRQVLKQIETGSVDAVCCDPPYHLSSIVQRFGREDSAAVKPGKTGAYERASSGFMGKGWDGGDIAFTVELWAEVMRVMKPGAHLAAFSHRRTYHRMAMAIETAGFDIRELIIWAFGSGFPKSHDAARSIDKHLVGRAGETIADGKPVKRMPPGATANEDGWAKLEDREYQPGSYQPITDEARQWQGWGTGLKPALEPLCLARKTLTGSVAKTLVTHGCGAINTEATQGPGGRYPANLVHDGSAEVTDLLPDGADSFFYNAKADADDRVGSDHPTVKPVDLMRWLVRLVTPPGGLVLDMFAGTGTTGEAAWREGCRAILIEREPEYQKDIARRMSLLQAGPRERQRAAAANHPKPDDELPIFAKGN